MQDHGSTKKNIGPCKPRIKEARPTEPGAWSLVSLVVFEAQAIQADSIQKGHPAQLQDVGQNSPAVHIDEAFIHNQVSPATSIYARV